jgi:hypothetical protein
MDLATAECKKNLPQRREGRKEKPEKIPIVILVFSSRNNRAVCLRF